MTDDQVKAISYGRENSFEALYSENNLKILLRKYEKKIDLNLMGAAYNPGKNKDYFHI